MEQWLQLYGEAVAATVAIALILGGINGWYAWKPTVTRLMGQIAYEQAQIEKKDRQISELIEVVIRYGTATRAIKDEPRDTTRGG